MHGAEACLRRVVWMLVGRNSEVPKGVTVLCKQFLRGEGESSPMVTRVAESEGPHLKEGVAAARAVLEAGGVVAIPTDTVYGLAVRADDDDAVRKLFRLKRRPDGNPLPILLGDPEDLPQVADDVPEPARVLAEAFWPGPLTLVLPKSAAISDVVTAGEPTVGLRVPDHPVARALLRACDFVLAVTSANLSAASPAKEPDDVRRVFSGRIELILRAQRCRGGVASTVVGFEDGQARVLRAGPVTWAQIQAALGLE